MCEDAACCLGFRHYIPYHSCINWQSHLRTCDDKILELLDIYDRRGVDVQCTPDILAAFSLDAA